MDDLALSTDFENHCETLLGWWWKWEERADNEKIFSARAPPHLPSPHSITIVLRKL